MKYFEKSLGDFLSIKVLFLSFFPFIGALITFFSILYFGGSEFQDILNQGELAGNFDFLNEATHPILSTLLNNFITKWIIIALFYTFGAISAIILSVFTGIIIVSFLTPKLVKFVQKKHYPSKKLEKSIGTINALSLTSGVILKFFGLFFISLLFLIIPFLNFLAFNVPFFYLFHKLLMLDVSSNILDKDNFKLFWKKLKPRFLSINLMFYIISLIPFLGVFLQTFFIIYLTHEIFNCKD